MPNNRVEKEPPRKMRIQRRWDGDTFHYVRIYSDGVEETATRKDADKYERAYAEKVRTVAT